MSVQKHVLLQAYLVIESINVLFFRKHNTIIVKLISMFISRVNPSQLNNINYLSQYN